jgi:hypothetical protein
MAITDAKAINPLLAYPFRMEFTGYLPVLITKAKLPGVEFEVVELRGGGQTLAVKFSGGEKVGEFTLETVIDATGEQRSFWNKRRMLQRTRNPKEYKIDGTLMLLGPDDNLAMQWHLQGAWFPKIEIEEFDSEDLKKLARVKITGACDDCVEEAL